MNEVQKDLSNDEVHGFMLPSCGAILQRRLRTKGSYGYAYERTVRYHKAQHTHTRMTIAKPRGSSQVSFIFPEMERGTYEISSEEILIFPSQMLHEQKSTTTIWDVLALYPAPSLVPKRLRTLASPLVAPSTALLDSLFDRLFFLMSTNQISSTQNSSEYDQILAILSQETPNKKNSANSNTAFETSVEKALGFIEAHLFEELTTKAIAKAAGRSSASLFRDFETQIGMSPKEYLRSRRFEEAAQLLHQSQLSIQDVCLMVGYEDVASFSKTFKTIYGLSPQYYRKEKSQKNP